MRKSILIATLLSFLIISATTFAFPPVPPPPNVSDDAYAAGWDGSTDAASKNAIYDKIETLAGGHDAATLTGDDANTTDGTQAMTIAGGGIVATTVAGSTVTVTGTEVDGDTTNEINTITADDANTTAGLAITVAGGGIAATTVAGDTVTVTATEVDSVVGAITGLPKADGAGNISAAVAGTDYAAADHDATHAVGGTDTVFPADPGADRYLMWDDDPGALVWSEVSAGGLFDSATGIATAADATLQKADPKFIFQNTDEEDSDGGRQSVLTFNGEQSGGEVSTLATITASHSATSDDEAGKIVFSVNDGNDGASPSASLTLRSFFHTSEFAGPLELASTLKLKGIFYNYSGSSLIATIVSGVDDGLRISPHPYDGYGNNHVIITSNDNSGKDHDHDTLSTNPTLFIHSATSPDTNNTQWMSFAHNQTNGHITTGTGLVSFGTAIAVSTSHVTCSDLDDTCAYTSTAQQHWITGGTDATGDTMTVTAGTDGQTMTFTQVAGTDDTTIDVSTGTDSTLADAGDSVTYRYNGTTTTWYIISSVGL